MVPGTARSAVSCLSRSAPQLLDVGAIAVEAEYQHGRVVGGAACAAATWHATAGDGGNGLRVSVQGDSGVVAKMAMASLAHSFRESGAQGPVGADPLGEQAGEQVQIRWVPGNYEVEGNQGVDTFAEGMRNAPQQRAATV